MILSYFTLQFSVSWRIIIAYFFVFHMWKSFVLTYALALNNSAVFCSEYLHSKYYKTYLWHNVNYYSLIREILFHIHDAYTLYDSIIVFSWYFYSKIAVTLTEEAYFCSWDSNFNVAFPETSTAIMLYLDCNVNIVVSWTPTAILL